MTREHAQKILPIIQAYADGKEIQIFDSMSNRWLRNNLGDSISFCDKPEYYRIKPEPREFFIVEFLDDAWGTFASRSKAQEAACGKGIIHVLEILK